MNYKKNNSKKSQQIRILIADDHSIFRDCLRRLLEVDPEFNVVGEVADGREVQAALTTLKPDILLLDLNMPRLDGMQVLRNLPTSGDVRIVVLTAEVQRHQIVEMLLLGACGLVMKDTSMSLLFKAIHAVMDNQYWIDRASVKDLVAALRDVSQRFRDQRRRDNFGLTNRELEIVSALAAGQTNRDIAAHFSISEETVKHHITNMFNKVGVSHRLELTLFALRNNLIKPESPEMEETLATSSNSRSSNTRSLTGRFSIRADASKFEKEH